MGAVKFKYKVNVDKRQYHNLMGMMDWCRDSIGGGGYIAHHDWDYWHIASMFGNSTFSFRREQDAVMFALKWHIE